MASKKNTPVNEEIIEEKVVTSTGETNTNEEHIPAPEVKPEIKEEKKKTEAPKANKSEIKYPIGSIVFISKEADADLNGFKLFPQYKKYTYTVEAYDKDTGVYSLRRLNLSLKLKEDLILAPSERAHDSLNRMQY